MLGEPTVVIYKIEGYTPSLDPLLRRRLKEMERREDLLKVQWRILREEGRLIVIIMHLKERDIKPLAKRFEEEINHLMEERGEGCRLETILMATITRPIPTPEDYYLLERFYRKLKELPGELLQHTTRGRIGSKTSLLIAYYLYMVGGRGAREMGEDLHPIFQFEKVELERGLKELVDAGAVMWDGERYRLTWMGLEIIEGLSGKLFNSMEIDADLSENRYLLGHTGKIKRFHWMDVVEDLVFSGVPLQEAIKCVKSTLHNLPGGKYVPERYLQWEIKQMLDVLDPTGRLSTKYSFFKVPETYLTVERDGRRYPLTQEVMIEEILKQLPRGRYLCSSEILENMIRHLSSVLRQVHMETVPTSFLQEDQEISVPYEELRETVLGFLRRYLPYLQMSQKMDPLEAAREVLKDSMHYFHRSEVLLETDPETALKYLLKAFKTLIEAELLSSGVHPTFSMSKNMDMLMRLFERSGGKSDSLKFYREVHSLYRRYKRKKTILQRDEELLVRGQSRAKELELFLRFKGT